MSSLGNLSEKVGSLVSRGTDFLKKYIFGPNNERLDFVMDSFYKLSPNQQTGLLLGGVAGLLILVFGAFGFYFSRVSALEKDLDDSFAALLRLRSQAQVFEYEKKRYRELKNIISRASTGFRPKPFFEAKSNQVGVSLTDLRSTDADIPSDSPLSQDFKNISVEFRLPKVSIPRLLKFLGELEKSGKNLNIHSLQIRTRYGDRLFFETNAKVLGYKVGRSG